MTWEDDKVALVAAGLEALLPPGYLKTVGFLIPAQETTRELIDWYENIHSVNASFMWPHMLRYQRNFIVNVIHGAPPFYKVITEFAWKSEEDKQAVAALYTTPAAARTVNETLPAFVMLPFPPKSFFMAPMHSHVVAHPHKTFRHDEARARKIMLLRCGLGESLESFEAAVLGYADLVSQAFAGAGVSADFRREAGTRAAPADALVFVDAEPAQELPTLQTDAYDIINIFDVVTLRSPIVEGPAAERV